MERRMRGNSHVRCGAGEKTESISKSYLSLLDTSYAKDLLGTFIADLVLQIMSFTAQNERENIRQRQLEGIAAAKARGVRFGREASEFPENFDKLYQKWREGNITGDEVAEECGMALGTLYRKLREQRVALDNKGRRFH